MMYYELTGMIVTDVEVDINFIKLISKDQTFILQGDLNDNIDYIDEDEIPNIIGVPLLRVELTSSIHLYHSHLTIMFINFSTIKGELNISWECNNHPPILLNFKGEHK